MASKDLRDIAAYYGAPYRSKGLWVDVNYTARTGQLPSVINGAILLGLSELDNIPEDFKLRLRPVSSLTDEEIGQIAILIGYEPGAEIGYIERKEWFIQFGDVIINSDDGTIYRGYYEQQILINTPAVYAYLQSIGVYVPGTIDEKYVERIENGK